MKSPYVGDLTPNDVITAQFLVTSKEIRQKKTGEPYLSLQLADRTGELEAKMWDNVAEVMHTFERDHFIKVKGLMQLYQKRAQFTIHKLRRLEDHEVDLADYFPCADRDPEEMFSELRGIISGIGNADLRTLLTAVFDDLTIATAFKLAPAAKTIHHACRGGLLQHVLSLCSLAKMTAAHYSEVDPDLLLCGAILHDIGKIEELSYTRSFGYSSEGQLLGHIILGLRIVGDKIRQLPAFPTKLRTLIDHMIISHHGELEFGSPKVPVFPEALLLHHLDNLDSKMEAVRSAIKREVLSEGEFTGWVSSLERVLLRKDRYLIDVPMPLQEKLFVAPIEPEPPPPVTAPAPVVPLTLPLPLSPVLPSKPALPAAQAAPSAPSLKPNPPSSPRNTLFGDKLQAVLENSK